ncbi:MAG: phage/plasmid primase, P4 family, partial [Candidatus Acidiferrum sp.]
PSPRADLPDWLLKILVKQADGEILRLREVTPRWAWQKFNKELAELRRTQKGDRNIILNKTAWWCARLSDHPLVKPEEVHRELLDIARRIGLPEREAQSTINSGWRAGLEMKIKVLPIHDCTDLGNADRFVIKYADRVRYVPAFGAMGWYFWNGHRWAPDAVKYVRRLAHDVVRGILLEAAQVEDEDIRKRLTRWAMASEADDKIDALLKEAQPYISLRPDELDADPELLNLENGTLDLRTGEVREQRQTDYITRMIPVSFEPSASCPLFDKHMEFVLPDPRVRDYFLEMVAYNYSGSTGEQCIHLLLGDGDTAKSTTSDLFRNMGGDYGHVVKRDFFADGYQGVPAHDVAELLGKRIVTCSEFEEGDILRVAVMKALTSGDSSMIPACRKYGHPFEFQPRMKFILDSNYALRVDSSDHGTWRRLRVIPFNQTIPADRKDRAFPQKLWAERSGIFNRVIEGLRRWNARGRVLEIPDVIRKASDKYKEDSDMLKQFIDEHCIRKEGATTRLEYFVTEYRDYAMASGVAKRKIIGQRALKERLESRGFQVGEETNSYGHYVWVVLGLEIMSHTPF